MRSGLKPMLSAVSVAGAIGYLAYVGAMSSWQYYMSVDETVTSSTSLIGKRIRVSGRVAAGTLKIGKKRREAIFELAGTTHTLQVSCRCAMPDNLAEDIDVVVEGVLDAKGLQGHKVMTQCASKYRRTEVLAGRKPPADAVLR